jgi:hypothetical protein
MSCNFSHFGLVTSTHMFMLIKMIYMTPTLRCVHFLLKRYLFCSNFHPQHRLVLFRNGRKMVPDQCRTLWAQLEYTPHTHTLTHSSCIINLASAPYPFLRLLLLACFTKRVEQSWEVDGYGIHSNSRDDPIAGTSLPCRSATRNIRT